MTIKFVGILFEVTIYDNEDIKLLVELDKKHEDICVHAIKKLMKCSHHKLNHKEYEKLANTSVVHLYHLRHSKRLSETTLARH